MKATKLPSGNYRALAYLGTDDNGKPITKSFTSPDAKHAVALASAYEDKHRIAIEKASLLAIMKRFFKDREPFLSPSTFTEYQSRYRVLIKYYPALCAKNIHAITADDLRRLQADLLSVNPARHYKQSKPRGLAPKTVKNYIGFIHSVFTYAECPFPDCDAPETKRTEIYVPNDEEVRVLIGAATDTVLYIPVLLAAFGPLRRGEICALTYPRDFNGNVIHVKENMARKNKTFVRKDPKTKASDRYIQMPGWVISEIEKEGYVTKLTPNSITKRFPALLKRAGLPDFRFHDLRHYCVSTLHAQGVPDAYIMQRGGWSTDDVLKRVYRHTLADQIQANAEKAISHFDNIFLSGRDKKP